MDDNETVQSLTEKLAQYQKELRQVNDTLRDDRNNEEMIQIKKDLNDIISLTTEMLELKKLEEAATGSSSTTTVPFRSGFSSQGAPGAVVAPNFFSVGTICEAKYSADGVWYKAKIEEILDGGKYKVTYVEYGNGEVVSITDIKPLSDPAKQGKNVLPMKRLSAPEAIKQIPKSLEILPTDSEEVRATKKKKIHSIKSQNRLKLVEDERNSVKNNWQKFQTKGAKKKVPMTLTHMKKGSIFASPDSVTGKVGVTGSGKAMTQLSGVIEPKDLAKFAQTQNKRVFMPSEEDVEISS